MREMWRYKAGVLHLKAFEEACHVNVPQNKIGAIIGKAGTTYREVMEKNKTFYFDIRLCNRYKMVFLS